MRLAEQYWLDGRLHRIWHEPTTPGHVRVVHERIEPPEGLRKHFTMLDALRDSRRERARKADGMTQVASITKNERDDMARAGVKLGDVDGLKWALKQDQWKHAKVSEF